VSRRRVVVVGSIALAIALVIVVAIAVKRSWTADEEVLDKFSADEHAKRVAADGRARGAPRATVDPHDARLVEVSGVVIDRDSRVPVENVEVVLRSATADSSATSGSHGAWRLRVPWGEYRAFVRDATYLSIATPDRVRVPGPPHGDLAGIPDDDLLPSIAAYADVGELELVVVRGGTIAGKVVARDGTAVARAAVRARGGGPRPALATDLAETNADGHFELRVPAGAYVLDAAHPRYAGAAAVEVNIAAGGSATPTLTLFEGCVVSGRVARRDGTPANDGAIEQRRGPDNEFGPAGRIETDGTFRWTTLAAGEIHLRAWPWRSPPSDERVFECSDGARHDVVFELVDERPDMAGTLVDASGAAVPFAFLDVAALDAGPGQQERSDGAGRWHVYEMPPGRFRIAAQAPGRGVVVAVVTAPKTDVRLALGGTGRVEGTTTELVDGSFVAEMLTCGTSPTDKVELLHETRLVAVRGGRFTIDDVPACELTFVARWRDQTTNVRAAVVVGDTAHVDVAIGPPRETTVRGVVRDREGRAIGNASVSAVLRGRDTATTRSDDDGRYELRTYGGAQIVAGDGSRVGYGVVAHAAVVEQVVDVVLGDAR
jgi:hypothetical protein